MFIPIAFEVGEGVLGFFLARFGFCNYFSTGTAKCQPLCIDLSYRRGLKIRTRHTLDFTHNISRHALVTEFPSDSEREREFFMVNGCFGNEKCCSNAVSTKSKPIRSMLSGCVYMCVALIVCCCCFLVCASRDQRKPTNQRKWLLGKFIPRQKC